MQQERGQIQVILFLLVIIGAVFLFLNSLGISKEEAPKISPSSTISSPKEEEAIYSPPSSGNSPVADNYSPFRLNGQPSGGLSALTREITISLETNEKATCKYSSVSGVNYDAMQYTLSSSANGMYHYASITALSEGRGYNYFIRCLDQFGNKNIDDFAIGFWVDYPADFTPPVLSNAYPSGSTLPSSAFETIIGVSTNEPASCRYSWTQGTAYDSMSNNLSPYDGTQKYHTAKITGLIAGNTYNYFVRCKDMSGNTSPGDTMIYFKLAP